ncbi:Hypothetical predicted protein [Pelobates cultripes]|uniref:Uncharacterized protein n=1 Tax=Pelobates cultripes TaxID=61616 RepID=A0AAD1R9C4_PELCU|nr:Hypothetical predicted protein [Pelobates cultripes]
MAEAHCPATRGLQLPQLDKTGPSKEVRDPIEVIFDQFWAKLIERTKPAMTTNKPP